MNEPVQATSHAARPDSLPFGELVDISRRSRTLRVLLEATDHAALVLESGGLSVGASRPLLESLHLSDPAAIIGQNPGEILKCPWASPGPYGCGAASPCAVCGIFRSLRDCRAGGKTSVCESLLSLRSEGFGTLAEFRMRAVPLPIGACPSIMQGRAGVAAKRGKESDEGLGGIQGRGA